VKLEFHPEALAEFKEAALYYSGRRRELELRYIAAVEATLQRIKQNPQRGRIFEADIRCSLTRVFPYVILYSIERDYLLVIAVMHGHREPGYWRGRIKSKT
jgi:plasmid stabilization system protein ParE